LTVLFTLLTLLAAGPVVALTIDDLSQQCAQRAGNLTALKAWAKEVEGEDLTVDAKFTRLDISALSGHQGYFLVGENWRLVTRMPKEKQLHYRIGEIYTLQGKIGAELWGKGLDITNTRGAACSGEIRLKVTQWP
jgi:hypothetical protein